MNSYIAITNVNILNGLLVATIPFDRGLNIISGENGTLKTKLLQELRHGVFHANTGATTPPRLQAISPKRNSERRAVEAIIQTMRQQNRNFDTYISERGGVQINDGSFENYPSLGDLFYFLYEFRCRDGGSQIAHMESVTRDFNEVISDVFPEYCLKSEWNPNPGTPKLLLVKNQANEVPLEALSLGEQEILSLITNLYVSKEKYDVFLIDEPEVHLNWHLEERLFDYLDTFCNRYEKQMIVVTHSRVIFKEKFLHKAKFLYWNDHGKVEYTTDLSPEKRRRLAGDAIEILKLGEFTKTTFFVEDEAHEVVVKCLALAIGLEVSVTLCGNSQNVRSMYKRLRTGDEWSNTYFLEDGDNEGAPFPGEKRFIHLSKYCIENYFLDLEIASEVLGKKPEELIQLVLCIISENKEKILGKWKFLDFLVNQLKPEDITSELLDKFDGSIILSQLLDRLNIYRNTYIEKYVMMVKDKDLLALKFPPELIEAIQIQT